MTNLRELSCDHNYYIMIILKLIILFVATIQDQGKIYIFFE